MRIALVTTISLLLLIATLGCGDKESSPESSAETDVDASETVVVVRDQRSARYVGVESCRECHADRVHSFLETAHPHTSRVVNDAVRERFRGRPRLDTRNPDLRFEPRTDDKVCWVTAVQGAERRREDVGLVIGSGKLFEGFLYWRGKKLLQLPIGVHADTREWANCPGYQDGTANFDRAITPRCMDCHATWIDHIEGTENEYEREGMILGVTCERCHGPGELHVEHHRSRPEDDVAAHILHPGSFTRAQRLDMCAQCHGDPGELIARAFTYYPGDPLDAHFARDEADADSVFVHTANQIQRLQNSKCFTDDQLECLTCHDPHKNQTETIVDLARGECAKCHETDACPKGPELPAPVRPRCVACHMPDRSAIKTTFSTRTDDYLDLVRLTEHRIGIHPLESDLVLLEWLEMSSQPAIETEADALRLDLVGRLKALADEERSRARYVEAASRLRRALELRADDDDARAMLEDVLDQQRGVTVADTLRQEGLAHLEAGRKADAEAAFRAAVIASPLNGEANLNLAVLLEKSNRPGQALDHYKKALIGFPRDARLRNNIGSLLARGGQSAQAIPWFQECLQLDGDHADAIYNLGLAFEAIGQFDKAAPWLEKAAQQSPDDVNRLLALTRLETVRGRLDSARQALAAAAALAPDGAGVAFARGALLGRGQEHEQAIAAFEQTVAIDPTHADAHLALGRYRAAQGAVQLAIGHGFDILNHDPENLDAHMLLGDIFAGARRFDDATKHWNKAMEIATRTGRVNIARDAKRKLTSIGR